MRKRAIIGLHFGLGSIGNAIIDFFFFMGFVFLCNFFFSKSMVYVVCGILSESRVYVGVFHKDAYKSFSRWGLGFSTILC